jgi:hypothetical protein
MKPIPIRRRAHARRGRTALVWAVAAFLFLQVALAVAVEGWLPELREPVYARKVSRLGQRVRAAPGAPVVLMLGTSRTAYGLHARYLEQRLARDTGAPAVVFNFGIGGAGPVAELLRLRRLLAEGPRPDLLLVEVMPPLLAGQDPVPPEARWLDPATVRIGELPVLKQLHVPVGEFRHQWWLARPLPWYAYRLNILSYLAPNWLPFQYRAEEFRALDEAGWTAAPPRPGDLETGLRNVQDTYAPYLNGFRLGGPACQALRETLDLCRRNRVNTALVVMPETTYFRSWYPPDALPQLRSYLEGLSREYAVPLIDARTWIGDADFLDAQHLLPRGARRFTRRLEPEVLALLRRDLARTAAGK